MAGVTRLELAASGVTGRRSNQLSYTPVLKRPRCTTSLVRCQAGLPFYGICRTNLSDLCRILLVGDDGFEPPTSTV